MSASASRIWTTIKDNWVVLVTVVSVSTGAYLRLSQLEYRMTQAERQITDMRSDFRDALKGIDGSVRRMEVQVAELTATLKAKERDNK